MKDEQESEHEAIQSTWSQIKVFKIKVSVVWIPLRLCYMTFEPDRFTDLQTDPLPVHCKAGVETSIGINLKADNEQLSDLNKAFTTNTSVLPASPLVPDVGPPWKSLPKLLTYNSKATKGSWTSMFVITRVKCVTINTAEFGELPLIDPISNMADNHYLLEPNLYLSFVSTKDWGGLNLSWRQSPSLSQFNFSRLISAWSRMEMEIDTWSHVWLSTGAHYLALFYLTSPSIWK